MDCCKTDNSVNQSILYFTEEERCIAKSAFQDGAEFGYNNGYYDAEEHYLYVIDCQHKLVDESKKAEGWHFVKDGDLPKDENFKLCISTRGVYYIAKYEEIIGTWTNQEYKDVCCPVAWCELPKFEVKE